LCKLGGEGFPVSLSLPESACNIFVPFRTRLDVGELLCVLRLEFGEFRLEFGEFCLEVADLRC